MFRKASDHIQQIQNNLVISQEVGKQGLETEKTLSKQIDELKMEVNVKNVQLNVAFRRLVDLGEKVRSE